MQKLNLAIRVTAALLFAAPGPFPAQTPPAAHLRAGAAKVDITPKQSDLRVSTDSIRDHLFARAIVVDDGSPCAVIVGLDLGGASNQIVDDATARASQSTSPRSSSAVHSCGGLGNP